MDSVSSTHPPCKVCGKPCGRSGKIYCSHACYWQDLRTPDAQLAKPCAWCGTMFISRFRRANQIYCSNACSARARSGSDFHSIACPNCGTLFISNKLHRKFCSTQCAIAQKRRLRDERLANRPFRACPTCGVAFQPTEPEQQYCSRACVMRSDHVRQLVSLAGKRRKGTHVSDARRQQQSDRARQSYQNMSAERRAAFEANQQRLPVDRYGITQCPSCGNEFTRRRREQIYCSRYCGLILSRDARWAEHQMVSRLENDVRTCLDTLGVSYQPHLPIGTYWVDIYIPNANLVIECNGCYWHACSRCGYVNEAKRIADATRKDVLTMKGYIVAEVWEHDLRQDMMGTIRQLLLYYQVITD